jgi:tetratricopeptide (TPR) repeat protein
VIPTREQLDRIAAAGTGSIKEIPFAVLLIALSARERSGVVELSRGPIQKRVVLESGTPVECLTNLAHETLGRFMVATGKLSEKDFTECLSQSLAQGRLMGEVLIERELVGAQDLYRILQQNLARKLLDLFTWREGDYRVLPPSGRVDSPLNVRVQQLLVTGIAKFALQEEVDAAVAGLVGKSLVLNPAPLFPLEAIRLPAAQRKLVDSLGAGKRIDELAQGSGLAYEELTRLLYALSVIDVVTTADRVPAATRAPAAAPPPPASPRPAPAEAAASVVQAPGDPKEVQRVRDEIMRAYLSFRKADAFEFFSLPESATSAVARDRYLELSRRFAPWQFLSPELADLTDKARELFLAAAQAYATLADEDGREALLRKRREAVSARAKPRTLDEAYQKLLDPALQYEKGLQLAQAGNLKEALRYFEFASDCDPQNGVYRAEFAYARFSYAPLLSETCLRDLREAMRIDPACGLAALYAGLILRDTGKVKESEPLLKRAAQLMPRDPRPREVLESLSKKGLWK